jgi:hypothetical protein
MNTVERWFRGGLRLMNRPRNRFVMLVPLAVVLFASLLVAQGPPNPCANECWLAHRNAVITCHGDAACLAAARAAAEACVKGCNLKPPR